MGETTDYVESIARISDKEHTVHDIRVDENHNFFAEGVLVHNCNYMLIDDPVKPMEAMSEQVRSTTNNNIRATLFSRFNDQRIGKLILIMQRLHEDDPSGHLLKDGGYYHLKLPAEAKTSISVRLNDDLWEMKPGELLFPQRLDRETLDKLAMDLTAYHYAGQYLQEPVPVGGGEFREEWVQRYPHGSIKPRKMNVVILVDPSGGDEMNKKKKKTSDWTAMMVVGLSDDHNYYLLDAVRDRLNPTERVETLFLLHRKWNELCGKPPKVGYEKYGLMADTHYIRQKQTEDTYHFPLIELGGRVMKEERIRQLIPDLQQGRWYFPDNLLYCDQEGRTFDLVDELVKSEMATFPKARFDDMLDALSRVYDESLYLAFPQQKMTLTQKAVKMAQPETESWMDF